MVRIFSFDEDGSKEESVVVKKIPAVDKNAAEDIKSTNDEVNVNSNCG